MNDYIKSLVRESIFIDSKVNILVHGAMELLKVVVLVGAFVHFTIALSIEGE